MKLKTLFFLLFVALSEVSVAQVLIGPTLGPQVSWVSFDEKSNKDLYKVRPVWGFHAGANLSFRVRKRFFLHSSFVYSQKGKVIRGELDPLLHNKVRYSYFELPMMYTYELKTQLKNGKAFKWYLGAGPNVSYWLGGKGELESSQLNEAHITTQKYKIVFKKADENLQDDEMNVKEPNRLQLGLNLSAGMIFEPLGYQRIMLTFRYELGHTFMAKNGGGVFTTTNEYVDVLRTRNNGFRISLAYLVDLQIEDRKKGKSTIDKRKLH